MRDKVNVGTVLVSFSGVLMRLSNKKTIIAIIIANVMLVLFAIAGKMLTRFDYEDHLDNTVISVDGTDITLREFGYYIYEVESFVQNQALLYDPENPKHWWNTHFSAGPDSQFVCDYAKKVALNTCICDQIYYKEAIKTGIGPEEALTSQTIGEARALYLNMTPLQLEATGLDEELIIEMHNRHVIASKYAKKLSGEQNFSKYDKEPDELLNWDGEYYQEEILPKHELIINDELLRKITLGKITVNHISTEDSLNKE